MKASIVDKIFWFLEEGYDLFSQLSLKLRIEAVSSLILFYLSLVLITHLTIYPYFTENGGSGFILIVFYSFVAVIAVLTILPILFPSLKKKSSIAMMFIIALNSLPVFFLILFVPKLREFKTTIFNIFVFLSIIAGGTTIILNGEQEGILAQSPEPVSLILWLLSILSIFTGMIIYSHVMERISIEKTKIETEIKIAQDIQSQLVPVVDVENREYHLFGKTKSADQIGGDFFEVIKMSDSKLMIAIGDVSGHNISAGLLMAISKGAFRTVIQNTDSLEKITESMNRTIIENSDKRMFVTFKCCEIDLQEQRITVVNAGHLPLYKFDSKQKKILEFNKPGLALGVNHSATYVSEQIPFKKGDCIYLLTDGYLEAMNSDGDQFDLFRIKNILTECSANRNPKYVYEQLHRQLRTFTGSNSLHDDITFVGIQFT